MRSPADSDGMLVIGYGSSLRGDDGAGPEAARRLREQGFEALAVHQLTPEIAEQLAAAGTVFFLDADARLSPGEIRIVSPREVARAPVRPLEHHCSPVALLHLAYEVYGAKPDAWLIAMGGSNFELREGLSEAANRAVAQAVRWVRAKDERRA